MSREFMLLIIAILFFLVILVAIGIFTWIVPMTLVNPFRKRRCPFCFERFYLGDCAIISTTTTNKVIDPPPQGFSRVVNRFLIPKLVSTKYTKELACRACPACKAQLPANIESMGDQIIGLVGGNSAGKSHYISSLIAVLKDGGAIPIGCTRFSPINDDVGLHYINEYYEPVFVRKEPITKSTRRSLKPLIYTMLFKKPGWLPWFPRTEGVYLVLFDGAGEDQEDQTILVQHSRYILNASALIFLIDPMTMQGVVGQMPVHRRPTHKIVTNREAINMLDRVIRMIESSQALRPGRKLGIPTAITIAKSDELQCIDKLDKQSIFFCDAVYGNQVRVADFKTIDDEVRALISEYDNPMLLETSKTFKNVSFFAISATGCPPDPSTNHFPHIKPHRCLDPLLWALWKLGVIEAE